MSKKRPRKLSEIDKISTCLLYLQFICTNIIDFSMDSISLWKWRLYFSILFHPFTYYNLENFPCFAIWWTKFILRWNSSVLQSIHNLQKVFGLFHWRADVSGDRSRVDEVIPIVRSPNGIRVENNERITK